MPAVTNVAVMLVEQASTTEFDGTVASSFASSQISLPMSSSETRKDRAPDHEIGLLIDHFPCL
ncbi:MAG: hypothetical protein EKK29_22030 [Hyphomicrobiales bacterium]|nr:MAG: hypothetical protein EKK29_22030 [Hyphomicrobiales bacterium]